MSLTVHFSKSGAISDLPANSTSARPAFPGAKEADFASDRMTSKSTSGHLGQVFGVVVRLSAISSPLLVDQPWVCQTSLVMACTPLSLPGLFGSPSGPVYGEVQTNWKNNF